MAKFRFHRLLSIVVLIAAGAWVATGEVSSVGSAAQENPEAKPAEKPAETIKPPRTVPAPPPLIAA